ncbi:hydrogenase 4 membrane subunit [Ferrimonas balearica]|uniref:hydrogenase 4 membrane subunit n=1 Tax=Ferrimonas balearica TaxID=44012 RepID=UPI001C967738|nr:hydrogenase 4 membrane subunit [Ferrimonas balearica]MBY5979432.1 hydrogenase 4 membrane subunit [Ferrimonas balearica]
MNTEIVINNLAGMLIVTSLMIIGGRNPKAVTACYALQSLILVGILLAVASAFDAPQLYTWSVTALLTKVIALPLILYFAFAKMRDPKADQGALHPAWLLIMGAGISLASFLAVDAVQLPLVAGLHPALAVSLGHFFLGLLCIISQRNILKQLFGYCLMENGSSLMLALLANKAPGVVEIGITIDAVFAVIFMVILVRQIYGKLETLDVQQLMTLKG